MADRTSFPGAAEFLPAQRSLAALRSAAPACRGCDLYADATQVVFGAGRARAKLMLVGEQPGDVEDRDGAPFVGPAGRVLGRALDDAELADVPTFVTNAVKHFHFRRQGNRRLHQTPRAGHIAACRPWLAAEAAAVRPGLIVCLGSTAVKSVLGNDVKVLRDRGTVLERESALGTGSFVVTIHPSAVLRAPAADRDAAYAGLVADLRVAGAALT
ncbi:MAG: uracil-DNA glycosylase [Pseudonocardiales bacterium]|nr:uracil-DNA glycosylase [Pseudonocardiales bacterium]